MVVFHARPEKSSLYSKDISGEIAHRFNEPAVFRTFETGLPSRNYKAVTQEKQMSCRIYYLFLILLMK